MKNQTKIKIARSAHDLFEAFVDPSKIGNFWFSSSSKRWEPGKTITLRYEEYQAEGEGLLGAWYYDIARSTCA